MEVVITDWALQSYLEFERYLYIGRISERASSGCRDVKGLSKSSKI